MCKDVFLDIDSPPFSDIFMRSIPHYILNGLTKSQKSVKMFGVKSLEEKNNEENFMSFNGNTDARRLFCIM